MNFPTKEAEVVALASNMATGLGIQAPIYPAPPVTPVILTGLITSLNDAEASLVAAKGAMEAATGVKLNLLGNLIEAMKKDIKYAENTVGNDNAKLTLIGWGARHEKTPLAAPGQTLELAAINQGEGTVSFSWKKPVDGGETAAYIIQRRVRPDGPWSNVATAMTTSCALENQERKIEWEFRIVAANKAGEGMPSNTVMVVL